MDEDVMKAAHAFLCDVVGLVALIGPDNDPMELSAATRCIASGDALKAAMEAAGYDFWAKPE